MKAGYLAVAAAMAVGVLASDHQAHGHAAFHNKERDLAPAPANCTCGSYTSWVTTYAEMTLHNPPPPAPTTTSSTSSLPPVVPTPLVTTCPTPGVYTIPATTLTITSTTTVCAATSTSVTAGTHTIGGVTTVVSTSTTVVCPVATTKTESGVVTSHIVTTTYVCPSAGTYTIAPITTTCVTSGIVVYPVPSSYAPGTYTQPQVVTTITETDYIVFCPYTSSSAPTSTSTSVPTTYAVVVPTSSSAPAPSQSSSPPALGNNGKQWAITYTPYDSQGNCKSASDVLIDITAIKGKGFSVVRIYSTDCSGLQNVGAACSTVGIKLILGVFIDEKGISGAQGQITDIVAWGQWSLVELIVIGNECIFGGHCQPIDLVNFIKSSKATFSGAGYSGPCTTTEPLSTLQEHKDLLCDVVDIVGANIHAFFNGGISASGAGDFVCNQELAAVEQLCPGKKGINLETGWPSAGPCNGVSCTGADNQHQAIDSIMGACGGQSVLFSYIDDKWKSGEWEQSFGCGELFL